MYFLTDLLMSDAASKVADIVVFAFWAGIIEVVALNVMLRVLATYNTEFSGCFISGNELMAFIALRRAI